MGVAAAVVGGSIIAAGMYQANEADNSAHAAREQQAAEQRQQLAAQQRIADIQNARERADIARKARLARAQIISSGANNGVLLSTGVAGGVASVQSQEAAQRGVFGAIALNQVDMLASKAREASAIVALGDAQGKMTEAQGTIALGEYIFTAGGGAKTIFDSGKTKK
jgi:hypothetical protein